MTAKYTRANGYEADCEVIYGDTDSVMVHFRVRSSPHIPPCRTDILGMASHAALVRDSAASALIKH